MLPALEELLHLHKFETVHFLGDNDTCWNFEFSREAVKLAKALPNGCILKLPRIGVDLPKGIDDVAEHLGEGFSHFWDQARDAAIPVDRKPDVHRLAVSLLRRDCQRSKPTQTGEIAISPTSSSLAPASTSSPAKISPRRSRNNSEFQPARSEGRQGSL